MSKKKDVFYPPRTFRDRAHIKSLREQKRLMRWAERDLEGFWAKQAESLKWFKKWDRVLNDDNSPFYKWFEGGELNVSHNCLDRHLPFRADKPAIIWQGEPEDEVRILTYRELYMEVNKFARALKRLGVRKCDNVCMYMPMIPELPISMLAVARIGAVHSVVFGGFSADALKTRIQDAGAETLITVDGYWRNGKQICAWQIAKDAVRDCPNLKRVIVVSRLAIRIRFPRNGPEYFLWDELMAENRDWYWPPETIKADDALFILYTSGSTGKPKGVVHSTGGYLAYATTTFKLIFDHREDDIYWCSADIGWMTGHSYIVYGPFSNGATVVMFEGIPTYPDPGRFWRIIEKFGVTIFYTAPTAIRALMREDEDWPQKYDLSSIRLLGTVGEPINPEVWRWYHRIIGKGRCPIVDTWWQTETGAALITPLPGATPLKPGSATLPFPGVSAKILKIHEDDEEIEEDLNREECEVDEMGYLVITRPWPGMMLTLLNDHQRYINTYFKKFGVYLTGDGAIKDKDGYFWLMGRIDDILLVSGHNISTAEVESALVSHKAVAEAAVVGYPHPVKGQGIYAFVILKSRVVPSDELKKELVVRARKEIGPIAMPEKIQFASGLPKTRSGKIMRRILKKIARGDTNDFGDTTTLLDPSIVDELLKGRV